MSLCIGYYLIYNSFYYLFDRKLNNDINENLNTHIPDEEKYKLYYNLANTYCQDNDLLNCILNLDQAISFAPYCYKCYTVRGLAKKYLHNYDGALSDFTKGLDIKEDAELYFNRGLLYDILKFKSSAIADYDAAMKIDNSFKAPKLILFNIYIYDDNIQEAKKI